MTTHGQHGGDCLHCVLWPVINKFCREHPDGYVHDVLMALADVIGDQLASDGSMPHLNEFTRDIVDRIAERTAFVRKEIHGHE
jgi:hypothetical protein